MRRCHECGHTGLSTQREDLDFQVVRRAYVIEAEVLRCDRCGSWTISHDELGHVEDAIVRSLAAHGPDDGASFRYLRKTPGLRAADLAELLDVTPETVSRWENDRIPIDRRAAALLGTIALEHLEGSTATIDRLRAYATGQAGSRRAIRLEVSPSRAPEPPGRQPSTRTRARGGT